MILCDVGVLLHAMVVKTTHHDLYRRELERLRFRPRELALSELILAEWWTTDQGFSRFPGLRWRNLIA